MKRFTVPCLFFGEQTSAFHFFVGFPNRDYHPVHFQAQWLLKWRSGIVDHEFFSWLKDEHRRALENDSELGALYSRAPQWSNLTADNAHKVAPLQRALDLTASESMGGANLLSPFWNVGLPGDDKYSSAKSKVITYVTHLILKAARTKPSIGCEYLLSFLLSYEGKSLSGVMQGIESQELRNISYALALIADTEGGSFNHDIINDFQRFMQMSRGDQLIATIETRNTLELWSNSSNTSENTIFDLTKFRRDVHQYFLP